MGGYLFDKWTPGSPFYIMATLNGIALVAALIIIWVERGRVRGAVEVNEAGERDPLLAHS